MILFIGGIDCGTRLATRYCGILWSRVSASQWANKVLKEYLLRGYAINQRLMQLEDRIDRHFSEYDRHLLQLDEKVDFFVRSSIQPKEGIFFDGQIFDAYAFVAGLIRKAKHRIAVIDSYVDDSVLVQLSKRNPGVMVDIYDGKISTMAVY